MQTHGQNYTFSQAWEMRIYTHLHAQMLLSCIFAKCRYLCTDEFASFCITTSASHIGNIITENEEKDIYMITLSSMFSP